MARTYITFLITVVFSGVFIMMPNNWQDYSDDSTKRHNQVNTQKFYLNKLVLEIQVKFLSIADITLARKFFLNGKKKRDKSLPL